MTTTTTTTKTILNVTEEHLKQNLIDGFKDIFNTYNLQFEEDRRQYEADFNRLTDCLEQMDKWGFGSVFKDGYTPMLLKLEDFEEVEKFFHENSHNDNTFEIHIKTTHGNLIIVDQDDISY